MLDDEQLKTALAMHAVSCDQICREIEAGQFDDAERHQLADTLVELAQDVRPEEGQ